MKSEQNFSGAIEYRPKIYISAHHDDFALYFDRLSNDLFQTGECIIFYDPDPEHPEDLENFDFDLSQMNLIVIPITYNFLFKDCVAFSKVFQTVCDRHIPFLPILTDQNLADAFNQKCGSLQALCLYSSDPSEISYETKLRKFMDSFFLNKEQIEEIRSEFFKYIFLSYRKKDRKKAQELMKLIHQDPQFADTAIWYDEFLSPGEDFNAYIHRALEKSCLFTMAVTSSLVLEPNYVQAIEYPKARKLKKTIVPVQMQGEDISLEQLKGPFPELTSLYAMDSAVLKDQLSAAMRSSLDEDPRHLYRIGLAYTQGIDVEIDYEKGIDRIEQAASQNYLPAIQELMTIYFYGRGTSVDLSKAVHWAKKNAQIKEDEISLSFAASFLEENFQLEEAQTYYSRALSFIEDKLPTGQDLDSRNADLSRIHPLTGKQAAYYMECHCFVLKGLGRVLFKQNRLEEAKEDVLTALEIEQRLVAAQSSLRTLQNLADVLDTLGIVCTAADQLKEARGYFLSALEIRQELAESQPTSRTLRDYSISLDKMGSLCHDLNQLEEAEEYLREALEINQRLVKLHPAPPLQQNLSLSLEKMGWLCMDKWQMKDAYDFFLQSLKIQLQLSESQPTPQILKDLSIAYDNLGYLSNNMHQLDQAYRFFYNSSKIRLQLARLHPTPQTQRDLSIAFQNLGCLFKDRKNLETAEKFFLKSLEILKQLDKSQPSLHIRRDLSAAFQNLGNLYKDRNQLELAKEQFLNNSS